MRKAHVDHIISKVKSWCFSTRVESNPSHFTFSGLATKIFTDDTHLIISMDNADTNDEFCLTIDLDTIFDIEVSAEEPNFSQSVTIIT